jgi:putative hydrolase of the HAD superfamily
VRAASEEQEAEGASFKYTDEGEPHSSLVKVVSLDFAGTLVSQDMMDYFWREVVPLLYSKRHGIWLSEAKDEVYGAYEQVGKTDVRWYSPRYWFERFGLADQLGLAVEEAGKRMKVYPDVAALRELEDRYRFVICSNASDEFLALVTPRLGIKVEAVYSAVSTFGLTAKRKDFYDKVAGSLNVQPTEIAHVGDDVKADFDSPREAGWFAVLLDRQRAHPDISPSVFSLTSLRSLLER